MGDAAAAANDVGRAVFHKSAEALVWISSAWKQFDPMGRISPGSPPYIAPEVPPLASPAIEPANRHLYFTHEGRLKRVADR